MHQEPVPADPGPDDDLLADYPELGSPHWRLVLQSPDWPEWMDDAHAADEDPGDLEEYEDPDNAPPPGLDDEQLAVLLAEARQVTADQARAAEAAARLGQTALLAALEAMSAGGTGAGDAGIRGVVPWGVSESGCGVRHG